MRTKELASYLKKLRKRKKIGISTKPLFKAVLANSLEMLEHGLQQPDIDINYKTEDKTALILSLMLERSDEFIMRLIEAGCDPNISTELGVTPLHLAVIRSTVDIAHALVKRGSDINIQDNCRKSPLYQALVHANLESVSMLLYYGAVVDVSVNHGDSLLDIAFVLEMDHVARWLMPYYSRDAAVLTCAKYIDCHNSFKLLIELLKAEKYTNQTGSVMFKSSKFLEYPWSTLNYRTFTIQLMSADNLSSSEWLECLYALLQTTLVSSKMQSQLTKLCSCKCSNLFRALLQALKNKDIDRKNRVAIIYAFLHLDVKINQSDLQLLYKYFGFNEELEAVIYCGKYYRNYNSHSMLHFILSMDTEVSSKYFLEIFKRECDAEDNSKYCRLRIPPLEHVLGFFALSAEQKQQLMEMGDYEIRQKVKVVPEIPSLVELSRNRVRILIKQNHLIEKPYQFYDILRQLNLPPTINNIICFKKPLY